MSPWELITKIKATAGEGGTESADSSTGMLVEEYFDSFNFHMIMFGRQTERQSAEENFHLFSLLFIYFAFSERNFQFS